MLCFIAGSFWRGWFGCHHLACHGDGSYDLWKFPSTQCFFWLFQLSVKFALFKELSRMLWGKVLARNSLVAQWVKDPTLSLKGLGLLLWFRFDSWLGNFHMLWLLPKKKRKEKKRNKKENQYFYIDNLIINEKNKAQTKIIFHWWFSFHYVQTQKMV